MNKNKKDMLICTLSLFLLTANNVSGMRPSLHIAKIKDSFAGISPDIETECIYQNE